MALQTKVIKQKIQSVANVQKVTKTMELVSVAKMRRAVDAMQKGDVYGKAILEMLVRLSTQRHLDHVAFRKSKGAKRLLVLFGSDRGLCGQYNVRVEKRVRKIIDTHPDEIIECVTLGKQAEKVARRLGITVRKSYQLEQGHDALTTLRGLVHWLLETYAKESELHRVSCVFNHYKNTMTYKTVRSKLLPLDEEALVELFHSDIGAHIDEARSYSYTVEPNEDEVLEEIIPELLAITMYHFYLDAVAAEHSARMVAMHRASDNAGRLKEDLVRKYNRARQEAVTKEIIEIINTAGAV
jgi:F-type H+-transporting ATPase subunit gamma